jgi:hypothetical protein
VLSRKVLASSYWLGNWLLALHETQPLPLTTQIALIYTDSGNSTGPVLKIYKSLFIRGEVCFVKAIGNSQEIHGLKASAL